MKRFFILLIALMGICAMGVSQTSPTKVERQGNTFIQVNPSSSQPVATGFNWKDSKGVEYPIFINPASGRCFVMRVSSRTGREYKYYLPEDIARTICAELNIEYKEKGGQR